MKTLFSDKDGNVIATTPYAGVTTCNQNFQAVLSRRGELEVDLANTWKQLEDMHTNFNDLRQLAEDRRKQVAILSEALGSLALAVDALIDNHEYVGADVSVDPDIFETLKLVFFKVEDAVKAVK